MYRSLYTFGQWLVYASLFLPLLIIDSFLFPFITPRNFVFRLFMLLAAGVVVLLWLNFKELRPTKKDKVTWAVFAVVAAKIVSSIFGVNFYNSFWSNYERMEGLITWIFFAVFFALVVTVFRTGKEWKQLFRVALIPAAIVALYGLGQAWELSFVDVARHSRIESRLGNAAYVGAYMVIHIGIAAYVWLKDKITFWRWFSAICLIGFHLAMFYSATRGAILGWFAGLAVALVLLVWWGNNKKIQHGALAVFAGLLVLVGVLFVAKESDFVRNTEVLRRMTTITLQEGTVNSRLNIWEIAWEGFKERPLFGWGQENFNYIFNKHFHSNIGEVWVDRAHNNLLDQLSMGGIVTFLAYLFLITLPFYYAWKLRKYDVQVSVLLFGLWTAYVVQNQFVFDSLNTYLLFFILIAFVYSLYRNQENEDAGLTTTLNKAAFSVEYSSIIAAGLLLVIIIAISLSWVPGFSANRLAILAFRRSQVAPSESIQYFKDAIDLESFGTKEIALQSQAFTQNLMVRTDVTDQIKTESLLMSIAALEVAQEREPNDVRLLMTLGNMYQTARVMNPAYLDEADRVFAHAVTLGPGRVDPYSNLAQIDLFKGANAAALEHMFEAIESDPKSQDAHFNLLQVLVLNKMYDEAYEQAVYFQNTFEELLPHQLSGLAQVYVETEHWDEAIGVLEILVLGFPDNATYWDQLATVYDVIGRIDDADAARARMQAIQQAQQQSQ